MPLLLNTLFLEDVMAATSRLYTNSFESIRGLSVALGALLVAAATTLIPERTYVRVLQPVMQSTTTIMRVFEPIQLPPMSENSSGGGSPGEQRPPTTSEAAVPVFRMEVPDARTPADIPPDVLTFDGDLPNGVDRHDSVGFGNGPGNGPGKGTGNGTGEGDRFSVGGKGGSGTEQLPDDEFIAVEQEPTFDYAALTRSVVYPELARQYGIEGKVVLRVLIAADGSVARTNILQSANVMLESAAIKAVQNVRFTPARQNGQAVACYVTIPVNFRLGR